MLRFKHWQKPQLQQLNYSLDKSQNRAVLSGGNLYFAAFFFYVNHSKTKILFFFTGATLEIITDKSQEGAQFVKGFGGIGGE
jgi:formate hydrogenlyase subunit 3/multisubunit Na+/H+ antiporter MnhD subunit